MLAGGCASVDTRNTSPTPWNRPTKAELYQGYWFQPLYDEIPENPRPPGDHYP